MQSASSTANTRSLRSSTLPSARAHHGHRTSKHAPQSSDPPLPTHTSTFPQTQAAAPPAASTNAAGPSVKEAAADVTGKRHHHHHHHHHLHHPHLRRHGSGSHWHHSSRHGSQSRTEGLTAALSGAATPLSEFLSPVSSVAGFVGLGSSRTDKTRESRGTDVGNNDSLSKINLATAQDARHAHLRRQELDRAVTSRYNALLHESLEQKTSLHSTQMRLSETLASLHAMTSDLEGLASRTATLRKSFIQSTIPDLTADVDNQLSRVDAGFRDVQNSRIQGVRRRLEQAHDRVGEAQSRLDAVGTRIQYWEDRFLKGHGWRIWRRLLRLAVLLCLLCGILMWLLRPSASDESGRRRQSLNVGTAAGPRMHDSMDDLADSSVQLVNGKHQKVQRSLELLASTDDSSVGAAVSPTEGTDSLGQLFDEL